MKACNQCGKCCQIYADGGLSATAEDIAWWQNHRPDIARYESGGKIWVDPDSGEPLKRCPFLVQDDTSKRFSCTIYHDRPEDCRQYPLLVSDMIRDECEMLEAVDIADPVKAQKLLEL